MKNPPYLIYSPSSGNSYYFRSWIPKDLRSTFGGLKEFRISLKCGIRSRSNKICRRLNKIVSEIYDQVRTGMKKLDIEDIKEILRIEIRKQLRLLFVKLNKRTLLVLLLFLGCQELLTDHMKIGSNPN